MISIIIPSYNASPTLVMTIQSALSQTYLDKEIIVIDDGSTDQSAEVINSFGKEVIAEFRTHKGVSFARNRGTELAKGDYIQYLDSDDILAPGTLKRRVEALHKSAADIVYTDWQEFTNDSDDPGASFETGKVIVRPIDRLRTDAEAACASAFWAPPAAILYRRWVVEAIGGWHTGLPVIQDARYLFDAARVGARFARVEGVGAFYRVSSDSLSRRAPDQFIRDCFVNASEIEAIWRNDGRLTKSRRQELVQIWGYLTIAAFRANLPEYRQALRQHRAVSGRPHLGMHLRMLLSLIIGQRAVSESEQRVRRLLRPVRQVSRRMLHLG
jgi:glycosyltransferase involved in cell wall biosynthesis